MIIPDESERVALMTQEAFSAPEDGHGWAVERLREFSYSVAATAEKEFASSHDVVATAAAAVVQYRAERQGIIDYRRRRGLPVTEP